MANDPEQQKNQPDEAKPGDLARNLTRAADRGVLSTMLKEDDSPYGSLVLISTDHSGHPLMLLSDLAQHTKNFFANPAASLLIDGTYGFDDPLTGPRATLMGQISPCTDPALQDRFIRRNPGAADYAGFGDFNLYQLIVSQIHLVAGFGAINRLPASDYLLDVTASRALAEYEQDIIAHMNDDHADALQLFAAVLLGQRGTGWSMTGIDPEGLDLRRAGETARLGFTALVTDPETARATLAALARRARGESVA